MGKTAMDREPEAEELEWISDILEGGSTGWEKLYVKYRRAAFTVALRILRDSSEAENAVHDTFVRVVTHLVDYRRERPFAAWFFTILTNQCRTNYSRLAKRGFYRSAPLDTPPADGEGPARQFPSLHPGPEEEALRREEVQLVEEGLAALPYDQREILILFDLEGASYEELTMVLDLPMGTVKSRLARARRRLADLVQAALGGAGT
jgi:RNA polymerase sigma-70 factor (ECF subfamily)